MNQEIEIIKNVITCKICGSSADRYGTNRFECQSNPNHVADIITGIFTDLTYPTMKNNNEYCINIKRSWYYRKSNINLKSFHLTDTGDILWYDTSDLYYIHSIKIFEDMFNINISDLLKT